MNELRVLILARGSGVRSALATAAAHPEIEVVDTASPDPAVVSRLAKEKIDAVVLYNDGTEASYELAERIYISKTVFSLIMVSPDMSQDSLERAMACGVNRLLVQSASESELARVVLQTVGREKNRASSSVSGDYYSSCVLSVFGTKGGAGKTTFAVNLAVALANRNKKVALVDLDLQFGDVGIFLDIEKADSIADVVEENAFDYATMKSYLFSHPGGVVGLCAPPSPEFAEIVLPEHVSRVVGSLKPHYDYVILDMPPAFQDNSIAGLEASSEIYFVITPDISALRNAKVSMDVLNSLNLAERIHFVLNKNGCSDIKTGDIERILERSVELCIPNDPNSAVKAVNRGVPIVNGDPRGPISKAINGFADRNLLHADRGNSALKRKM